MSDHEDEEEEEEEEEDDIEGVKALMNQILNQMKGICPFGARDKNLFWEIC